MPLTTRLSGEKRMYCARVTTIRSLAGETQNSVLAPPIQPYSPTCDAGTKADGRTRTEKPSPKPSPS